MHGRGPCRRGAQRSGPRCRATGSRRGPLLLESDFCRAASSFQRRHWPGASPLPRLHSEGFGEPGVRRREPPSCRGLAASRLRGSAAPAPGRRPVLVVPGCLLRLRAPCPDPAAVTPFTCDTCSLFLDRQVNDSARCACRVRPCSTGGLILSGSRQHKAICSCDMCLAGLCGFLRHRPWSWTVWNVASAQAERTVALGPQVHPSLSRKRPGPLHAAL